jgi:hypothetical protein
MPLGYLKRITSMIQNKWQNERENQVKIVNKRRNKKVKIMVFYSCLDYPTVWDLNEKE